MSKNALFFFLLLGLGFLVLSLRGPADSGLSRACFQGHCFEVSIAQTPDQRSQGLMFEKSLDDYRGMLFVFQEEDIHGFWMKNMLIPLDIIWMNESKEVVFIKKNAQPCQQDCLVISPLQEAKYVLELNANMVDNIHLQVGDELSLEIRP